MPTKTNDTITSNTATMISMVTVLSTTQCDAGFADGAKGYRQLDSDDFIEALHDMRKFFWRGATESCTNALDGKGADLADLDPRAPG